MRNLQMAGVLVLLTCSSLVPAWAGGASPQPSFCVEDSPACRGLAVEVAMLDIADRIDNEVDLRRSAALLCPAGDPACCPPGQTSACHQIQTDLVVEARRSYQSESLSSFGNCPFGPDVCGSIGGIFCGPGDSWTPWGGCATVVDPPIYCPLGWSRTGFSCQPPLPCRCGFEHNSKGLCIPKRCFQFGLRVPCIFSCGQDWMFEATNTIRPAESNLGRHLADRAVQLEAAKRIRAELDIALVAVEKEIEELSGY